MAGIAPDLDPTSVLPATEARAVDRYVIMALIAEGAMADAGLGFGAVECVRRALGDAAEATAIRVVFGDGSPVSSRDRPAANDLAAPPRSSARGVSL